jgi:DNA polymerase III gamma/tau subunit
MEVDAASHSGAEHMRSMLDIMNSPPSAMCKRRVLLIDEAHDLSGLAWDVALKPLESKEDGSVFIFASSKSDLIPYSISSRCVPIPFERVHTDSIFGLLVNIANQKNIQYELEALKIIARKSKGIVRDAVLWLGMVASMGTVTRDLVVAALDDTLEDLCHKCYAALVNNDQVQAVQWIDEAGRNYSTGKVIEVMFSIYARTPWAEPGSLYAVIASRLPNLSEVDAIFIKWLSNNNLPADALPLVVYELINTLDVPVNSTSRAKGGSGVSSAPPMGGIIPADSIESFFND